MRQNILFGEEYDKERYEEVIRICALIPDISQLEQGDLTILSDRGQNLSKGQQARINLARTVYRNSNIYLLDDSLTALDSHVQEFIFNECIMKFLKDKIVILVTQNPRHINKAAKKIVLNEGKLVRGNIPETFHDMETTAHKTIYRHTKEVGTTLFEERANRKSSKFNKMVSSENQQQERRQSIYREIKKQGGVDWNTYQKYFDYGGGILVFLTIILLYVGGQFCDSYSDKLITNW